MWRRDVYVTTLKILLLLFCILRSYLSHIDCLVVILTFYTVPMCLNDVRNFVNQKVFSNKHLSIVLPRKYEVVSQLRHSYANSPFCMTRLNIKYYFHPLIEWSGHIVFVLSACLFVCLSVVKFHLRYNFWTIRDRYFISGMRTSLMMPLKWHHWLWPWSLNKFLNLVAAGGHRVSVTQIDFSLCSWLIFK